MFKVTLGDYIVLIGEVMKPILLVDFNNMAHRARAGFGRGDHALTYTFFLILRKAVETFDPSRVYIIKEGRPLKRREAFTEYKAGRTNPGDDFWRQHADILEILSHMPVHIVRHAERECDDVIAHLTNVTHVEDPVIVLSTDSDFIQLLKWGSERVRLWNPTKDKWIDPVPYDYVKWKSLVGDGSDGIPGFKGIGTVTAQKLLEDQEKFESFLEVEGRKAHFERNHFLITFEPIQSEDEIEKQTPQSNWENVQASFGDRGFGTLLKEKTWTKFVNTFAGLS